MIVTHTSPDWDAIGAVWQLRRHFGLTADIGFVNTGSPDAEVLAQASAVVDTGKIHDPENYRFDHHQFPGAQASATSATELVYLHSEEMLAATKSPDAGRAYLRPIIDLITDADGRNVNSDAARHSRALGIHAQLSAWKAAGLSDAELMQRGMAVLDSIEATLLARWHAAQSLEQHTAWKSPDGRVWTLLNAPRGATAAAFEEGAVLVIFANTTDPATVAVGCQRHNESNVDVGALVGATMSAPETGAELRAELRAELARWFRHPAGFFAGRGTAKAPDATPLTADIAELARALWVNV